MSVTLSKEEVVNRLKSEGAAKLCEDNQVLAAYLFGSVAEERTHAHSDVDVAVLFNESVPRSERFDRRLSLVASLTDLLGTDDLNIVSLKEASLLLAFNALRNPVVLYKADEYEAAEFEIKTIGMYYDFRPTLDQYSREMFRRIKEYGLA